MDVKNISGRLRGSYANAGRAARAPGRPTAHRLRFPGEESLRSMLGLALPLGQTKTLTEAGLGPAHLCRGSS